jgi:hypothetical protein
MWATVALTMGDEVGQLLGCSLAPAPSRQVATVSASSRVQQGGLRELGMLWARTPAQILKY